MSDIVEIKRNLVLDNFAYWDKHNNVYKQFILDGRQEAAIRRFSNCNNWGILLLHKVGTGKTITSLLIALNTLKNTCIGSEATNNGIHDCGSNDTDKIHEVIVVAPPGIFNNFLEDLDFLILRKDKQNTKDKTNKIFTFFDIKVKLIDYGYLQLNTDVNDKNFRDFKDKIVIFDEAHRLLTKTIYNSYEAGLESKPKHSILEDPFFQFIIKDAKKVITMTGTPMMTNPSDLLKLSNFLTLNESSLERNKFILSKYAPIRHSMVWLRFLVKNYGNIKGFIETTASVAGGMGKSLASNYTTASSDVYNIGSMALAGGVHGLAVGTIKAGLKKIILSQTLQSLDEGVKGFKSGDIHKDDFIINGLAGAKTNQYTISNKNHQNLMVKLYNKPFMNVVRETVPGLSNVNTQPKPTKPKGGANTYDNIDPMFKIVSLVDMSKFEYETESTFTDFFSSISKKTNQQTGGGDNESYSTIRKFLRDNYDQENFSSYVIKNLSKNQLEQFKLSSERHPYKMQSNQVEVTNDDPVINTIDIIIDTNKKLLIDKQNTRNVLEKIKQHTEELYDEYKNQPGGGDKYKYDKYVDGVVFGAAGGVFVTLSYVSREVIKGKILKGVDSVKDLNEKGIKGIWDSFKEKTSPALTTIINQSAYDISKMVSLGLIDLIFGDSKYDDKYRQLQTTLNIMFENPVYNMELIGRDMSKFTSIYDYLVQPEINLKLKLKEDDQKIKDMQQIYKDISYLFETLSNIKKLNDEEISEIKTNIITNYPDLINENDNKSVIIEKITQKLNDEDIKFYRLSAEINKIEGYDNDEKSLLNRIRVLSSESVPNKELYNAEYKDSIKDKLDNYDPDKIQNIKIRNPNCPDGKKTTKECVDYCRENGYTGKILGRCMVRKNPAPSVADNKEYITHSPTDNSGKPKPIPNPKSKRGLIRRGWNSTLGKLFHKVSDETMIEEVKEKLVTNQQKLLADCSPAPSESVLCNLDIKRIDKRFPVPIRNVCVLNFDDDQVKLKRTFLLDQLTSEQKEILNMDKFTLGGKPFKEQFEYYQKNMKWISNYSNDVDLYSAILDFRGNHYHNRYVVQKRLNPHYNKVYRVKRNYNGLHNRIWGMTAPWIYGKPTNIYNPLIKGSKVIELINSPNNTDWVECKYYIEDNKEDKDINDYKKYIEEIYNDIFKHRKSPSSKEIHEYIERGDGILFENNDRISKILRPKNGESLLIPIEILELDNDPFPISSNKSSSESVEKRPMFECKKFKNIVEQINTINKGTIPILWEAVNNKDINDTHINDLKKLINNKTYLTDKQGKTRTINSKNIIGRHLHIDHPHVENKTEGKEYYLPVVYSYNESLGTALFGAYLNSIGKEYILIHKLQKGIGMIRAPESFNIKKPRERTGSSDTSESFNSYVNSHESISFEKLDDIVGDWEITLKYFNQKPIYSHGNYELKYIIETDTSHNLEGWGIFNSSDNPEDEGYFNTGNDGYLVNSPLLVAVKNNGINANKINIPWPSLLYTQGDGAKTIRWTDVNLSSSNEFNLINTKSQEFKKYKGKNISCYNIKTLGEPKCVDLLEYNKYLAFKKSYVHTKDTPICVIIDPTMTEGLNAKYNPALFILESCNNYGDSEQVEGRVLRKYSAEHELFRFKAIYQYISRHNRNEDTKDIINNSLSEKLKQWVDSNKDVFELSDRENVSNYVDTTGNTTVLPGGERSQDQSKYIGCITEDGDINLSELYRQKRICQVNLDDRSRFQNFKNFFSKFFTTVFWKQNPKQFIMDYSIDEILRLYVPRTPIMIDLLKIDSEYVSKAEDVILDFDSFIQIINKNIFWCLHLFSLEYYNEYKTLQTYYQQTGWEFVKNSTLKEKRDAMMRKVSNVLAPADKGQSVLDDALYQALTIEAKVNLSDKIYGGKNSMFRSMLSGLKTEHEISSFNNKMGLTNWYSVDEFNDTMKNIDKDHDDPDLFYYREKVIREKDNLTNFEMGVNGYPGCKNDTENLECVLFSDIHEIKTCNTSQVGGNNDIANIDPDSNVVVSEGDSGPEKGQIECKNEEEMIILSEEIEKNKDKIDEIKTFNDLDDKMRNSHIRTNNSIDVIRQIKLETENSFWYCYTEMSNNWKKLHKYHIVTLYLTLGLDDKFEEDRFKDMVYRCYLKIRKDYLEMNFTDLKKLFSEEDTETIKQITTKKGWLSGYLGDKLFQTEKNKLDLWLCNYKIMLINNELNRLFNYLSRNCDVSILIKILTGEDVEKDYQSCEELSSANESANELANESENNNEFFNTLQFQNENRPNNESLNLPDMTNMSEEELFNRNTNMPEELLNRNTNMPEELFNRNTNRTTTNVLNNFDNDSENNVFENAEEHLNNNRLPQGGHLQLSKKKRKQYQKKNISKSRVSHKNRNMNNSKKKNRYYK